MWGCESGCCVQGQRLHLSHLFVAATFDLAVQLAATSSCGHGMLLKQALHGTILVGISFVRTLAMLLPLVATDLPLAGRDYLILMVVWCLSMPAEKPWTGTARLSSRCCFMLKGRNGAHPILQVLAFYQCAVQLICGTRASPQHDTRCCSSEPWPMPRLLLTVTCGFAHGQALAALMPTFSRHLTMVSTRPACCCRGLLIHCCNFSSNAGAAPDTPCYPP